MRSAWYSHVRAVAGGLALALVCCPLLPADQIVALVDEHGHKVYINTGEKSKRADWMTWSFSAKPPALSALPPQEVDRLVKDTSERFRVDPQLVHAIIKVESEYDPNAVSSRGAMGLMQLIPATARRFGVENPFDPQQNIEGGVNYLKYLLDTFGGDLALSLAAYNAGEHSVLRTGRIPSFSETRDYVRKVTRLYQDGFSPLASKSGAGQGGKAPILRYVDAQGVVHFTNVY
jgi:hypothetical protein